MHRNPVQPRHQSDEAFPPVVQGKADLQVPLEGRVDLGRGKRRIRPLEMQEGLGLEVGIEVRLGWVGELQRIIRPQVLK